ncbi:MAG TPA: hypothetical protein VMA54_15455 [Steroidobacteraceae bacterium]|nr:hypothetical protein [Steroidobacteraceae bacterium]
MLSWGRHSERAVAAAVAVLLQVSLYLALSHRHPFVRAAANAPSIFAMILTAARPKREVPTPRRTNEHRKRRLVSAHPVAPPVIPANPPKRASRPPFDWQGAIQGEVGKQLTPLATPPKMQFGFPKMPAEEAAPNQWGGWNEAHIDRVQRLAHGIIDLGHGCYMLLYLPIPQCPSEPPNGDLFKDLHGHHPDEIPGSPP